MARVCQVRTQQASSSHITSHHITPPTLILRLHPVKDKFVELGIATFDDLRDACLDDDVLLALKSALPVMSFSKFRSAVQRTRGIDSTKLTMSATVTRSSDCKPSASATGTASGSGGTARGTSSHASLTLDDVSAMIAKVRLDIVAADDPSKKRSLQAKLDKYAELSHVMATSIETKTRAKEEAAKLAKKVHKTEERIKALAGMIPCLLHDLDHDRIRQGLKRNFEMPPPSRSASCWIAPGPCPATSLP
jgi:hypothetical protein